MKDRPPGTWSVLFISGVGILYHVWGESARSIENKKSIECEGSLSAGRKRETPGIFQGLFVVDASLNPIAPLHANFGQREKPLQRDEGARGLLGWLSDRRKGKPWGRGS
jgi:hypothetical protein